MYFIITIDTEGDNLWDYRLGGGISTENARFIPRFQRLCGSYGYKPVYLVNYEMAEDSFFVDFARDTLSQNQCEIGLHVHAWNSPPFYELPAGTENRGLPYLIEYPPELMRAKIDFLLELLEKRFCTKIASHRAGRWAMNQTYFDMLIERGLLIDCSVTPHVSWEKSPGHTAGSKGADYAACPEKPFTVSHSANDKSLFEVPVTIRMLRSVSLARKKSSLFKTLLSSAKKALVARPVWLRPDGNNLDDMLALIDHARKSDDSYLMFMLHSSELMPGGSPSFKTAESIEKLYRDLTALFDKIAGHYRGITLKDFYAERGAPA
jgi:hypothetical protein